MSGVLIGGVLGVAFSRLPVCQSHFSTAIDNVFTEDGLLRFRRLRNDIVHRVPGSMQTMP